MLSLKMRKRSLQSLLHFQEIPASEMDQTALLMYIVSLGKGGSVESQAVISSAYLLSSGNNLRGSKSSF